MTIRELSAKYSVFRLCSELCVSRSSYYKWLSRKPSKAEMRNKELDEKIVFLFDRYDEAYGYRRIADELMSEFGIRASRKYVLHRMRTLGIRSRIRKKKYLYKPCQKTEVYENILARRFRRITGTRCGRRT